MKRAASVRAARLQRRRQPADGEGQDAPEQRLDQAAQLVQHGPSSAPATLPTFFATLATNLTTPLALRDELADELLAGRRQLAGLTGRTGRAPRRAAAR